MLMAPAVYPAVVSGEAQNLEEIPAKLFSIPGTDGDYLMKSDGFYCAEADGTKKNKAGVCYFDQFMVEGTCFNGYYYYSANGEFRAGNAGIVPLFQMDVAGETEDSETFHEGYYFAGNLGKLSAAPQVRNLDQAEAGDMKLTGYYYFDGTGRLHTETGIHILEMECGDELFQGSYYFGGENGALIRQEMVTEYGIEVDASGKVINTEALGMDGLQERLEESMEEYEGEWSVYVKNLETEEHIMINARQAYSASLIKPFVMAKTFEDLEEVTEHEAALKKVDPETAQSKIWRLLDDMIVVSDNESFNELVRLQTEEHDFIKSAEEVNEYLEKEGYTDTEVLHTLHPSVSAETGDGRNMTSVMDCGLLLERIYKGTCVSETASEQMLEFLLIHDILW